MTFAFSSLNRVLVFALVPACVACGGTDDSTAPRDEAAAEGAIDDLDRAAAQEELGRITQGLGEATCASTPADAVLSGGTQQLVASADGSYDHPTCRNGFVVDVPGVAAGRQLSGGPELVRWPDPFTCLLHWGYAALYQKQPDGSYVKVTEASRLGTWAALPQVGFTCSARVGLTAPADGDYKVVTSGGILFGPYSRVTVY